MEKYIFKLLVFYACNLALTQRCDVREVFKVNTLSDKTSTLQQRATTDKNKSGIIWEVKLFEGWLKCWRTTQAVHFLLLQQADVVVVSIQYQFCLWALTGHSRAAEKCLRLPHIICLQTCDNKHERKGHRCCIWPFEGKVFVRQVSHKNKLTNKKKAYSKQQIIKP